MEPHKDSAHFIVLASQTEDQSEQDIQNLPALSVSRLPPTGPRSTDVTRQLPGLAGETSAEEEKPEGGACVLVTDSEIEAGFSRCLKAAGETGAVVSETEDPVSDISDAPGNITAIYKASATKVPADEAEQEQNTVSGTGSNRDVTSHDMASSSAWYQDLDEIPGISHLQQGCSSQPDIFGRDEEEVATPSEHIGSLHLSGQSMLVPETVEGCDEDIPPSPGVYGGSLTVGDSPGGIENDDQIIYDPGAASTLGGSVDFRQLGAREKSASPVDCDKSDKMDNMSVDKAGIAIGMSTLRDEQVDKFGGSLYLHYTATDTDTAVEDQVTHVGVQENPSQKSTGFREQEVIELDDSKEEESIVVILDESKDVSGESQHLSLRLSPSQSNNTQASKQSQRKTDTGGKMGPSHLLVSESKESGTESGGFHLSLPREGTLLHPVSSISPMSIRSPRKQAPAPSQASSSPTPTVSIYKEMLGSPLKMGQAESGSQSTSDHSFRLDKPVLQDVATEPSEDVRLQVFKKAPSFRGVRTHPHRYILNDDSSDEEPCVQRQASGNKRILSQLSEKNSDEETQLHKKSRLEADVLKLDEGEKKELQQDKPFTDILMLENTEQYQPDQPMGVHVTDQPMGVHVTDQPMGVHVTDQQAGNSSHGTSSSQLKPSRQNSETPGKKAGRDPFEFHDTQSQKSPGVVTRIKEGQSGMSAFASRSQASTISSIIPQQTEKLLSTLKRKRLVHKKSGLKTFKASSTSEISAEQKTERKKKKITFKPSLLKYSTLKETKDRRGKKKSMERQSTSLLDDAQLATALEVSNSALVATVLASKPSTSIATGEQDRSRHYKKTTIILEKSLNTVIEIISDGVIVDSEFRKKTLERFVKSVVIENLQAVPSPRPSPSRSTGTMTSGDLGDVSSSLSRSNSSKTSSLEKNVGSLETQQTLARKSDTQQASPPKSKESSGPGTSKEQEYIACTEKEEFRRPTEHDIATRHVGQSLPDQTLSPHEHFSPHEPSIIDRTGSAVEGTRLSYESLHSDNLFSTSPDNSKSDVEKESPRKGHEMHKQIKKKKSETGIIKTTDSTSKTRKCSLSKQKLVSVTSKATQAQSEASVEGKRPTNVQSTRSTRNSSGKSGDISPEIPFQDQEVSSSVEEDKLNHEVVRSELRIGCRTIAKWKDGYFYPGIITGVQKKIQVKFDDGDLLVVKIKDVLLVEKLPIGQGVMVQSADGYFESGLIVGRFGTGENVTYRIEKDGRPTEKHCCTVVILSEDQAACLRASASVASGEISILAAGASNLAEVRLENLVEGKRKTGQHNIDIKSEPLQTPKGAKSLQTPKGAKKQKLSSVAPMATSTPTRKMKIFGKDQTPVAPKQDEQTPRPTKVGAAFESPVSVRRSPRKARIGLYDESKDLVHCKSNLFHGMAFLLTHIDKSPEQLKSERQQLQDSSQETTTDDSPAEDANRPVLFNKLHLKSQIAAGGGVVLEKYDESQVLAARHCFLISDQYQRTVKYFQCLAAGIPCVSHLWIRDSCRQDKLLNHKAYTLPAGFSLELKKLVECKNNVKCLQDMRIIIFSQNPKFKEEWTTILEIAKCRVSNKLTTHGKGELTDIDVIVTDASLTKSLLKKAKQQDIFVVSTEWVIQCLINSYRVGYDNHPRYRYDFYSDV